ncbi:hypothetical protein TIFTF001_053648 [Ficus carica]|uniref:Uncharacterized protein n=1 Tax=Ficus carica TaxID=3494 RepID=A0AA88EE76_FICCA|nr:hypothetical protein TIFTF001_053648 [Ficus carica]
MQKIISQGSRRRFPARSRSPWRLNNGDDRRRRESEARTGDRRREVRYRRAPPISSCGGDPFHSRRRTEIATGPRSPVLGEITREESGEHDGKWRSATRRCRIEASQADLGPSESPPSRPIVNLLHA